MFIKNLLLTHKTVLLLTLIVTALFCAAFFQIKIKDNRVWKSVVRNPEVSPGFKKKVDQYLSLRREATLAWRQEKNLERSERLFRKAMKVWPEDVLGCHDLAQVLKEAGKLEEAYYLYKRIIYPPKGVFPSFQNDQKVWLNYAELSEHFGDKEEAQKAYAKITSLVKQPAPPDDPKDYKAVARILRGRYYLFEVVPIKNAKAERYFQEAIDLSPNYWAGYYYLGDLYLQQKKYEKAEQFLEKSLTFQGVDQIAKAAINQGLAIAKSGKKFKNKLAANAK